jgi:hypothetical protein
VSRRLKIFFHDNCFDGTASAAMFAAFYRDGVDRRVELALEGVQHRLGDPFAGRAIDGDDNACVDFRYCDAPEMTWWFDHHKTAFQPPVLREHWEADRSGQKIFDPEAPSCAGLVRRTLTEQRGWTPAPHLDELARWADVIDGARFATAADAVSLDAPAMRLAAWVASVTDEDRIARYVEALRDRPLAEVAEEKWIAPDLSAVADERVRLLELIAARARRDGDVVLYDLSADGVPGTGGFLGYALFPDARYTIAIAASDGAVKISVGSNPWSPQPRGHDIAAICERYGGGGHAVVGGVTLPRDQLERARSIARAIRDELQRD